MATNKARREQVRKWREEEGQRKLAHRQKLESQYPEFGPKTKNALWSLAWEEGHASGENEISIWYHEYAEFAQVVMKEMGEGQ